MRHWWTVVASCTLQLLSCSGANSVSFCLPEIHYNEFGQLVLHAKRSGPILKTLRPFYGEFVVDCRSLSEHEDQPLGSLVPTDPPLDILMNSGGVCDATGWARVIERQSGRLAGWTPLMPVWKAPDGKLSYMSCLGGF